jgi:hypothetical protein
MLKIYHKHWRDARMHHFQWNCWVMFKTTDTFFGATLKKMNNCRSGVGKIAHLISVYFP